MSDVGRLRFHRVAISWPPVPGRRLGEGGALTGALTTTGYFSTTICLGTPPRSFELVVDTGSSITSVPCRHCVACGTHRCGRHGRFDEHASSTSERAPCTRTSSLKCEACNADGCTYRVGYLEGSAIQGRVLRDTATFAAGDATVRARVFFGCQLFESGKFRKQAADGILGLQVDDHSTSPRSSRIPSVLHALTEQHAATSAFSLCLSDRAGLLLLGGRTDPAALLRAGATVSPMLQGSPERFTLRLLDVLVEEAPAGGRSGNATAARLDAAARRGGRFVSLGVNPRAFNPTLVDSGTTFFFASTPLWRAIHTHLKRHMPQLRRMGPHHVCAHMTDARRDAMPALQLRLAGSGSAAAAPLYIRPRQYMVRYPSPRGGRGSRRKPGERHYCAEIFNNGRSGGTVLGASALRGREVIFDVARSTIAFIDADCDATTQATAHMRGAFAFAPSCSAEGADGNGSAATAPAHGHWHQSTTSGGSASGSLARRWQWPSTSWLWPSAWRAWWRASP